MKLTQIRANMTVVELTNQVIVLFSYSTPVAASVDGKFIRTAYKWSNTTTRHINQWLDGRTAEIVPQEFLDDLAEPKVIDPLDNQLKP